MLSLSGICLGQLKRQEMLKMLDVDAASSSRDDSSPWLVRWTGHSPRASLLVFTMASFHEVSDLARIACIFRGVHGELVLEHLGHDIDADEVLSEVVMELVTDLLSLALRGVQDLLFQLFHGRDVGNHRKTSDETALRVVHGPR